MKIEIPVSVGELLDKITILQIKSKHTDNEYVTKELQDLTKIAQELEVYKEYYLNELLIVNSLLWNIHKSFFLQNKKKKCLNMEYPPHYLLLHLTWTTRCYLLNHNLHITWTHDR